MANVWLIGDRNPSFLTHRALDDTIARFPQSLSARWVGTDSIDIRHASDADALWVVPGTPYRNTANVYSVIQHARKHLQPLLATCGGFQYVVVEYARNMMGLDVGHAESEPDHQDPIIEALSCSLIGEIRTIHPVVGTKLADICGVDPFEGFHWCNYGLAERYTDLLVTSGLKVSARAADAGVEAVELTEHPFYIATLFQPQVMAPVGGSLHPLIDAFIEASGRKVPAETGR